MALWSKCAGVVALALLPTACISTPVFRCSAHEQCGDGYCEATGFCSFVDDSCSSGWRYGELAGSDLRNACVGAESSGDGGVFPDADLTSCESWVPLHFSPCELPPPSGLQLDAPGQYTYDTTSGRLTDPDDVLVVHSHRDDGAVTLVSVNRLVVGGSSSLRVIGDKPLLVASWDTIEVAGTIDVGGAEIGQFPGAGGRDAEDCLGAPGAGAVVLDFKGNTGGGGGGGGFGGAGGNGAAGSVANATGGQGGEVQDMPTALIGGCPGASGGYGPPNTPNPGQAGGAVQLTARVSIQIDGLVTAGGGGGGFGEDGGGGGGGGSGGLIVLEAPTVVVDGAVTANGGGGGGGACGGSPGQPGMPSRGIGQAEGGNGGINGDTVSLRGGDGSFDTSDGKPGSGATNIDCDPGVGESRSEGGGGGGGGAGFILVRGTLYSSGTISPVETYP